MSFPTRLARVHPSDSGYPTAVGPDELADFLAAHLPAQVQVAQTLFVSSGGDDGTGQRGLASKPFLTLGAAKAAAQSGDTVLVYPGAYTPAASLAKDGVNWHFFPGTTVTFTEDSSVAIWDDGGAAMTFRVSGSGTFTRNGAAGSAKRAVTCSHADSNIDIQCLDLITAGGASDYVIRCEAGTLLVNCRDVRTTAGTGIAVWWGNGRMTVNGRRCGPTTQGCWSEVTAVPTGDGHCRFDEIVASTYCAYDASTDTTAAFWVRANILKSTSNNQASVALAGTGRLYVEAQKLFGQILANGGGLLYVRADKISKTPGFSTPLYVTSSFTGEAWVTIAHWDATGITGNAFPIQIESGTTNLLSGALVSPSTAAGASVNGGTARFRGFRIDTTAQPNADPLRLFGTPTVSLDAATVLVAEAARDSISSAGATTVKSYGAWANKAVNVNVTVEGELNVDATVV